MTEPFIKYVTLFQSRISVAGQVLAVSSFGHQPKATVLRKLRARISETQTLHDDDTQWAQVVGYLAEKRFLVSAEGGSQRYPRVYLDGVTLRSTASREQVREMDVYRVDVEMSDPEVRSSVGTPTVENAREYLDLALILRLLSPSKFTWTSAGQLLTAARSVQAIVSNPFVLSAEVPVLLRQLIEADRPLLSIFLRCLTSQADSFRRDEVAMQFGGVAEELLSTMRASGARRTEMLGVKEFVDLIKRTSDKRAGMSSAPGVLEHRVTPRLEWLTDLGYLGKPGQRNVFEYTKTPSLIRLTDRVGDDTQTPDAIAMLEWNDHEKWADRRVGFATFGEEASILKAYGLLRRRIGPTSLRDVAFLAGMLYELPEGVDDALNRTKQLALRVEGASLSKGRFGREISNIFIPPLSLEGFASG